MRRAGHGGVGVGVAPVAKREGGGEWEAPVGAVVGEEDALGAVADPVAVEVFVVGEVFWSDRGVQLDDRDGGCSGEAGDQRDEYTVSSRMPSSTASRRRALRVSAPASWPSLTGSARKRAVFRLSKRFSGDLRCSQAPSKNARMGRLVGSPRGGDLASGQPMRRRGPTATPPRLRIYNSRCGRRKPDRSRLGRSRSRCIVRDVRADNRAAERRSRRQAG